jgi:copper homeostasis protein
MNFKLEICTDSVESAIYAQNAGAHRIELCNNLTGGGTTPGYGTIVSARKNLDIGLNVIIRPRSSDFLYSDIEYDIMRRDIDICGELGIDGVVLGILRSDGTIDLERTAKLVEYSRPMSVTFHRAFDMSNDPIQSLRDVIATGAKRLLTSGQRDKAADGVDLISNLIKLAGDKIIIMPGSGISDLNIEMIARMTGAKEYHLSAGKVIDGEMIFRKQGISMGGVPGIPEYSRKVADQDMIRIIIKILNLI